MSARTFSGSAVGLGELGHERFRAALVERCKRERREAGEPAAPVAAALDELGPGQGDDHERHASGPPGDGLHQVEEGVVPPLHVLQDDAEWSLPGQRLEEPAGRAVQRALVDEAHRPVALVVEAREQCQVAPDVSLVLGQRMDGLNQLTELGPGCLRCVVGGGTGGLPERFRQGRVAQRLAVGQAPAAHHQPLAGDHTLELGQLSRLAHAGLAEDGDEVRAPLGDAPAPGRR